MNLSKNLDSWKDENQSCCLSFNEYLAGLIDGDGSLLISKAGYASCEITIFMMNLFCLTFNDS